MHTNPTVGDSLLSSGAGSGNFTSTVNTLNANTTYYLRAYAINEAGTAYGNEITFNTEKGPTSAVSDILALSVKSGGNISNDGGASITERGLVYATTVNSTTSNFKIIAPVGTGSGTFSSTLLPLASQQTYYVRAYAINNYGTAYGNQIQFNAALASTLTNIDGNVYTYVTLCGKDWMASRLKTTNIRMGMW